MRFKAILQARIAAINGILLQAGKRLSKDTTKKLKEIMDKMQALMDGDTEDGDMMEQAWSPVGQILMQGLVTGQSTKDSWENIKWRLNQALQEKKPVDFSYFYTRFTWSNIVVFDAEKYDGGKWTMKQFRATYTPDGDSFVFGNIEEVSVEQVVLAMQERLAGMQEDTEFSVGTPSSYLMERADGNAPVLFQMLPGSVKLLQETTADGRPMISGIATQGNVLNKNVPPVVYPTDVWSSQMAKMQELIQEGKALGCLNHPKNADGTYREPLLQEYAIKYTELKQEGNFFPVKAEILQTSAGQELTALLQDGVGLDLSTAAAGKFKKGKWGEQSAYIVQKENFSWLRIADVVLHGASPGSAITEVRLQSLDTEPEKEKAKMTPEEIRALIQEMLNAGISPLNGLLQALNQKLEGMGQVQTASLSDEDKKVLEQAQTLVAQVEAQKTETERVQARDTKIEEIVPTLMQENKIPAQFKTSVVEHFKEMCQSADEVEAKKGRVLQVMKPFMEQHELLQSKGWYEPEYNDDGTKKAKMIQSLDEGVEELLQSAEVRGLFKKQDRAVLPFEGIGPDGQMLRDFSDMRQNLKIMCQTLVSEHPEAGKAYLMLRNGMMKKPEQSLDLMSERGAKYLMQVDEGTVTGNFAGQLPYALPMIIEMWPQLLISLFATIQPLTKSTGRAYWLKHRYDDDHAYMNTAANFTGSYANNTEGGQVKYIDAEITYQDVATQAKKLGWKSTIEALRNLMSDFGIDGRSDLLRICASFIALEWNYNHLASIVQGATAGNVNYGTTKPADNSFDGEQWQKQIHRHVQKARSYIWKKTFAGTYYVFGDSDSIDRIIDGTEKGILTGTSRGEFARGVDIVGSITSGETLVKVAWWDQMPGGVTNKLVFTGRGQTWPETGYVVLPYLGMYVTPEFVNPDDQKVKQSMLSEVAEKMVDGNYFSTMTILPGVAGTPL